MINPNCVTLNHGHYTNEPLQQLGGGGAQTHVRWRYPMGTLSSGVGG